HSAWQGRQLESAPWLSPRPLRAGREPRARPRPHSFGSLALRGTARLRPIILGGLAPGLGLGRLEAGRHRGGRAGQHLVLAYGERHEEAKLDELGLAEMALQAHPERVIGLEIPDDRLGIGQRCLLPLAVACGFLEIEEVAVVLFDHASIARFLRALVAAIV